MKSLSNNDNKPYFLIYIKTAYLGYEEIKKWNLSSFTNSIGNQWSSSPTFMNYWFILPL